MRTSISNKIMVIFLIIVLAMSFTLVLFFQSSFSEFVKQQNSLLIKKTAEYSWNIYTSSIEQQRKLIEKLVNEQKVISSRNLFYEISDQSKNDIIEQIGIFDKHAYTYEGDLSDFSAYDDGMGVINSHLAYKVSNENFEVCVIFNDSMIEKTFLNWTIDELKFSKYNYTNGNKLGVALGSSYATISFFYETVCASFKVMIPETDKNTFINSIILICLLLLILSSFLGRFLVQKVSKPLEYIIDNINEEQLNKNALYLRNDDEMELLVDEINSMKKNIIDKNKNIVEQRNRLKTVLEKIGYSIVIIDKKYNLIDMNSRGGCFGNYNSEMLLQHNRKCYNIFLNKDSPCEGCYIGGKIDEMAVNNHIFSVTNDRIKYFEDDEEVCLVVSRDITLDVLNSRKIFELDRLAQIGKVTSAVTHELKNPLAVIKSSTYYLDRLYHDDIPNYIFMKEYGETTKLVNTAIERAEYVVKNLLELSKERPGCGRKEVNLDTILKQILLLYRDDIYKKRIKLDQEINIIHLEIAMDTEILKSILMNIICNAVEAVQENGVIRIKSDIDFGKSCYIIIISDNGCGILDEEKEKIFESFYSSKTGKENAGLGLWIVKNEISKSNGRVYACNNSLNGVDIVIELPKEKNDEKGKYSTN